MMNCNFSQVPSTLPVVGSPKVTELGVGAINEQILRLMQSLGIDPARTKEVNSKIL